MTLSRRQIRKMILSEVGNVYGWDVSSRETMLLDQEGMAQSDKDNQEKYLKSMAMMESKGVTYKMTEKQLRSLISEVLDLDLEVGDIIFTGRFKNKRTEVKDIGVDDMGQPTVNGRKALSFRIEKLMTKSKQSKETKDEKND